MNEQNYGVTKKVEMNHSTFGQKHTSHTLLYTCSICSKGLNIYMVTNKNILEISYSCPRYTACNFILEADC